MQSDTVPVPRAEYDAGGLLILDVITLTCNGSPDADGRVYILPHEWRNLLARVRDYEVSLKASQGRLLEVAA